MSQASINALFEKNIVTYWGQKFAHKFDLTPYKKVLETGCRQGILSHYLAEKYPYTDFMAIDNLAEEIEKANPASNVQFWVQDALSLPFKEDFDAIVSLKIIYQIALEQGMIIIRK